MASSIMRCRRDALATKLQFPARNAGEIEQIVDQACFQLDIAPHSFEIFSQCFRDRGVLTQAGENRENRCEGRSQLVAERGQKKILRLVRLLRGSARLLFRLITPGHVHRGRCLRCDAPNDFFVPRREDSRSFHGRKTNRPRLRRSARAPVPPDNWRPEDLLSAFRSRARSCQSADPGAGRQAGSRPRRERPNQTDRSWTSREFFERLARESRDRVTQAGNAFFVELVEKKTPNCARVTRVPASAMVCTTLPRSSSVEIEAAISSGAR